MLTPLPSPPMDTSDPSQVSLLTSRSWKSVHIQTPPTLARPGALFQNFSPSPTIVLVNVAACHL